MSSNSNVILTNLYEVVKSKLSIKSNMVKFNNAISKYIEKNSEALYFHSPAYRIYYSEDERNEIYSIFDLNDEKILSLIDSAFYFKIKNYNPRAMKDPLTVLLLNCYRYCNLNKVNEEQALTYLCFSPKVYISIHSGQFRDFAPSEGEKTMGVMNYTISNLSNKYEIKKTGTLKGSVINIANSCMNSYDSRIKRWSDEDQCYLFQQLHNRIKQSLITLCREYYKNLENPKSVMLFYSDNYSDEGYRITENNSMMVMFYANKSINSILSNDPNIELCKASVDSPLTALELDSLLRKIVNNSENTQYINKIVYNTISVYYTDSNDKKKDIRNIGFINYSLTKKANSKNKEYLEINETIKILLEKNSEEYRKSKKRSVQSAYIKSLYTYIVLAIHKYNIV